MGAHHYFTREQKIKSFLHVRLKNGSFKKIGHGIMVIESFDLPIDQMGWIECFLDDFFNDIHTVIHINYTIKVIHINDTFKVTKRNTRTSVFSKNASLLNELTQSFGSTPIKNDAFWFPPKGKKVAFNEIKNLVEKTLESSKKTEED